MDEERMLTPEWLEANGFADIRGWESIAAETVDYFPSCFVTFAFDVDFKDVEHVFLERQMDRNQFCVTMQKNHYTNGEIWYTTRIYVQYNIGCGFTQIPSKFTEMTEHHFRLLYEAIRREKL